MTHIKNIFEGVLYTAETATDIRAAVVEARLRGADLRAADLSGADLRGADLRGAIGVNPWLSTPLMMLLDQPGPIRAYKLIRSDGTGCYNTGYVYPRDKAITYVVGESYSVPDADCNSEHDCGSGINVATADWCIKEWKPGYRILLVEHATADIACVPGGSDGKYRVHRCTVISECDLARFGLPWPEPEKASAESTPTANALHNAVAADNAGARRRISED